MKDFGTKNGADRGEIYFDIGLLSRLPLTRPHWVLNPGPPDWQAGALPLSYDRMLTGAKMLIINIICIQWAQRKNNHLPLVIKVVMGPVLWSWRHQIEPLRSALCFFGTWSYAGTCRHVFFLGFRPPSSALCCLNKNPRLTGQSDLELKSMPQSSEVKASAGRQRQDKRAWRPQYRFQYVSPFLTKIANIFLKSTGLVKCWA